MPLHNYREVKIKHGKKLDQMRNFDQKKWMKICSGLGLHVVPAKGKGSHCAVYKDDKCEPKDRSCLVLTIPKNTYRQLQRDLTKKLISYGKNNEKFTEEHFWEVAGI